MKSNIILSYVAIFILLLLLNLPSFTGLFMHEDTVSYCQLTTVAFDGQGFYSSSWHNKPPGIHYIYWLAFFLFGRSVLSVQILGFLANVISLIFTYLIAKTWLGRKQAFISAMIFGIIISSGIYGTYTANTETFVIPFTGLGIFLFLQKRLSM